MRVVMNAVRLPADCGPALTSGCGVRERGGPLPVMTAQRSPGTGRVSDGGVSAFRDAFAALPSGPLALNDVRPPEFVIHEDCRMVAYYAPSGCLNRHPTAAWRASHLA